MEDPRADTPAEPEDHPRPDISEVGGIEIEADSADGLRTAASAPTSRRDVEIAISAGWTSCCEVHPDLGEGVSGSDASRAPKSA
jgi:hypothetical protein